MINFVLGFIFGLCCLLCYHAAIYLLREKPNFANIITSNDALADLHKKIDSLLEKVSLKKK